MDISELYAKPASYKFSDEEIAFIKKKVPKSRFKAKYALYKPKSSKGCYIGFFIDSMPYSTRRSGIENHWEFICERQLTNIEYQEQIENWGTNHRRFHLWMYQNIDNLIHEDLKYNVNTPEEFVRICRDKGYSGDFQTKIEFF